jgi:hypothetical protein
MRLVPYVLLVAFAACQPLYGGAPEHLHTVEKKRKPPEALVAAVPIAYVEECNSNFQDDPKKKPPPALAALAPGLVAAGDTAMANSDKETDEQKKVGLWRDAVDKYRNALLKDPYSVDATLDLALAYDRLLRKGCALAMLKRLVALQINPKYTSAVTAKVGQISDNAQWFKGYRKDAMTAVGQ